MIRYKFSKNMDILFIGINPHFGSYKRGVPFSNNKTFWYLLNAAGILNENLENLKKDSELKKIYNHKFKQKYHLGFINIINRPTIKVSELKKGEEIKGRNKILKVIKKYKPKIVCFVGKISYEKFLNKKFNYGWKHNIFDSRVFVMHSPTRGKASIRIYELKKIKGSL